MSDTEFPARWWHATPDGRIQCDLCPRDCKLNEGQRGMCFVRQRVGDQMVLTTYGRSSGFCIDPIEKKPLNHFYPGSSVLSFGTAGCNLACKFCQNWDISKSREMDTLAAEATPDTIAKAAVQMGAASLVVLDAGNRRQSSQPPRCLADQLLAKVFTALRQQVLVDAPLVAQQLPVVYLPAPALPHHSLFDFAGGTELIEQTAAHVTHFLATEVLPTPGTMCGTLQFQAAQPGGIPGIQDRQFDQPYPAFAVA